MSNEYMSTGDESVTSEDTMGTDNPDPAEHLRTHRDEVPMEDADVTGRPDLQTRRQGEVHDESDQAADQASGETRNQRNP
ncbi:hypothetical protein FVO59_02725 [Microbacterium esteraromaticum]|uniref:Uncharacterized protein n=1 Tax=Microbacterium esteraromaticum TaxID=57043 RepID=A0A7D8A918_9MICO|nr:hypothetical protein [Microbacterium esteraromaticum]QMU96241.1 hypothetical protein FVO59_02725 [Microbacterium esteraromaticum]